MDGSTGHCATQTRFQTSNINSGAKHMKRQAVKVAIILAFATSVFMIGSAMGRKESPLNKTTRENLSTAMRGEAFAYAKYMLYAEHARKAGNEELAKLFEASAKTERFEHFAEEARLAGLVGSDADNLKDAMKGESYEVETMYRDFSEEAAAAGDEAAAQRFEEIRHDEMKHRDAFQAALVQAGNAEGSTK
jgi:rubrerythrin